MSCPVYKVGGIGWEGWITAQGLAGHRSVSGEQLHCASLGFFLGFISPFVILIFIVIVIITILYFISIIKLL